MTPVIESMLTAFDAYLTKKIEDVIALKMQQPELNADKKAIEGIVIDLIKNDTWVADAIVEKVNETLEEAADDFDFDSKIQNACDNFDFASKVDDAFDEDEVKSRVNDLINNSEISIRIR